MEQTMDLEAIREKLRSEIEAQFSNRLQQMEHDLIARQEELAQARQAVADLTAAMRKQEAERRLEEFHDRVPPAAREEARALLLHDSALTFSDTQTKVGALFAQFLAKLPAFGKQTVKGQVTATEEERRAELIAFYRSKGLSAEGAAAAADVRMKEEEHNA